MRRRGVRRGVRPLLAGLVAALVFVGYAVGVNMGNREALSGVPSCPSFYGRAADGEVLPLCVYEGFEPVYHEWGRWLVSYGRAAASIQG